MKSVVMITLGCKVNQYDTHAMSDLLKRAGYCVFFGLQPADIYIINTCTVTNMADKKSRQMIERAKRLNPDALVCVCGCMAQKDAQAVLSIPGVSCVLGTGDRENIVRILDDAQNGRVNGVGEVSSEFEELPVLSHGENTRGYLKIQEGCENFCSYCIIPYVRGKERSRSFENILAEAKTLTQTGIRELVLTGIHVSSYQDSGRDLADLICALSGIPGLARIRLGSLEQSIMTEHFLRRVSKVSQLCPHFHLSLQSGCDAVLKRMNRKYTADEYAHSIALIRRYYAAPAITTDVITGFPGETEEEFVQTEAFVRKTGFAKLHVFPYSEREGTVAAKMPHSVPMNLRRERANRLISLGKELEAQYLDSFLDTEQEVLFEQETGQGLCVGHTERYIRVIAHAKPNEMKKVLLKERKDDMIFA